MTEDFDRILLIVKTITREQREFLRRFVGENSSLTVHSTVNKAVENANFDEDHPEE